MTPPDTASPYVGLRPFREQDAEFFFARDREIRIIVSNLQARPLTTLYGSSGVGKSSVLQAGVVRHLRETAGASVLYFRDWQSDSLLSEVTRRVDALVPAQQGTDGRGTSGERNDSTDSAGAPVFLLFDQFEEFLLYHPAGESSDAFDGLLARLVNRKGSPAHVLIGIREDSLSKLDRRFGIRIPNLLRNTLEVERLTSARARLAIVEPLKVFSQKYGGGKEFEIEPELVDELLLQSQAARVTVSESSGVGTTVVTALKENQIESAFLQLVLKKVWEEERRQNSTTLRARTLKDLGGAGNIVRSHVNAVMDGLASSGERDIAASMFRYLVTPSGTKVAQAPADLVSYAERPDADVRRVLDALTEGQDARILRRLSNPEQYEIYHDVLAQPLLDWRQRHAKALATRHARRIVALVAGAALVCALLAVYAFIERHKVEDAAKDLRLLSLHYQEAEKQAQVALANEQAAQASKANNQAAAEAYRIRARQLNQQVSALQKNYTAQIGSVDSASKLALVNIQTATQARDDALHKLASTQAELTDTRSRLEAAHQEIDRLQKTPNASTARPASK